jgi:secreted PhoX family phosphatase
MHEPDHAHSNPSSNPTFGAVLAARLTRRQVLQGSLGAAVWVS